MLLVLSLPLPAARCPLSSFAVRYLLPATRFRLPAYPLPAARCPLPATRYPPLLLLLLLLLTASTLSQTGFRVFAGHSSGLFSLKRSFDLHRSKR